MNDILRIDNQGEPYIESYEVIHDHHDIVSLLIRTENIYSINFVGHNSDHHPAIDIEVDILDFDGSENQGWTTISFPKYKGWNVLAYHVHGKKINIVLENPMETI